MTLLALACKAKCQSVAVFLDSGRTQTPSSTDGSAHLSGQGDTTFASMISRHTFATWLLEAGVDYIVIEKLLGHRLPGTGDLYIHDWV